MADGGAAHWWQGVWSGERAARSQFAVAAANAEARGTATQHRDLVQRAPLPPTRRQLLKVRRTYAWASAADLLVGVVWLVAAFKHRDADDLFLIAGVGWTIRAGYELWRVHALNLELERQLRLEREWDDT